MRWNIKIFEIFSFSNVWNISIFLVGALTGRDVYRTCSLDQWNVFFELQWFVWFLWLGIAFCKESLGKEKTNILNLCILEELLCIVGNFPFLEKVSFSFHFLQLYSNLITKVLRTKKLLSSYTWSKGSTTSFGFVWLKGFCPLNTWPQCGLQI